MNQQMATEEVKTVSKEVKALDEMAPRVREAFDLIAIEGRSVRETAEVMGVSPQTIYGYMKDQRVTEAILAMAKQDIAGLTIKAIHSLDHLMTGAKSEKVRLEATTAILDRAGLMTEEQQQTIGISIDLNGMD